MNGYICIENKLVIQLNRFVSIENGIFYYIDYRGAYQSMSVSDHEVDLVKNQLRIQSETKTGKLVANFGQEKAAEIMNEKQS